MHATKEFVIRKQQRTLNTVPLKPSLLDRSGENTICVNSSTRPKNKISIRRSVKSLRKGESNESDNKDQDIETTMPKMQSPKNSKPYHIKSASNLRHLGSIEDVLTHAGSKSPRFGESPLTKHKFYTPTARTNPHISRLKPINATSFDTMAKMHSAKPMLEKLSPGKPVSHFKARSEMSLPLLAGAGKSPKKLSKVIGVTSFNDTMQGCDEDGKLDKPNQDYSSSKDLKTDRGIAYIRLVADGHGPNGHLVSQLVSDKMIDLISDAIGTYDDSVLYADYIKEMLMTSFETADSHVLDSGIDINFSGSTLTVVIVWQNMLAIANTGDSKAVLFSRIKNLINISAETCLHHPEEETEKKRIMESGGVIAPYKNKEGEFDGPLRVWKHDYSGPGLAVARSFGDSQGKEVGIISRPGNK